MKYRLVFKNNVTKNIDYGSWHTEEELHELEEILNNWSHKPLVDVIIEKCVDEYINDL